MKSVAFFRNDDVGEFDASIVRLTELFQKFEAPLSYEVVPANVRKEFSDYFNALPLKNIFDVGQHGYAHRRFMEGNENRGEFGANRKREDKRKDIVEGWESMKKHFGSSCVKVFIPPWGLMDEQTYEILRELGYEAFSCIKHGHEGNFFRRLYARFGDPLRLKKHGMFDFSITIDPMKNFQKRTPKSADELMRDFKRLSKKTAYVGVMLHDKIMNDDAFAALEEFLRELKREKIPIMNMRQIIEARR